MPSDAHDIGESVYHALLQRAASFSSEGDQVLARIPDVGGQGVVRAFLEGSVAALDNAFAGLDCCVRADELACDETELCPWLGLRVMRPLCRERRRGP